MLYSSSIGELKSVLVSSAGPGEGKTTTVSSTIYDIVRKLSSGKKINLVLNNTNKLHLESEKSNFNLNKKHARPQIRHV